MNLEAATLSKRVFAKILDVIIIYILMIISELAITGAFIMINRPDPVDDPGTVIWDFTRITTILLVQSGILLFYATFFLGRYGATPGKMALRIKVVQVSGKPLTYGIALKRNLLEQLSLITFGYGYLMAFIDEEHRTLHDKLCGTQVIDNE